MQPSDTTPTPAPTPDPQSPKQGFWAKLFGKKPTTMPTEPPHGSNTPPPRLDENAPEASPPSLDIAQPHVDSILGNVESESLSAPDSNGEVTSLPIEVPDTIQSSSDGHAPTVPTDLQPLTEQQVPSNVPQPPVEPQSFNAPTAPAPQGGVPAIAPAPEDIHQQSQPPQQNQL